MQMRLIYLGKIARRIYSFLVKIFRGVREEVLKLIRNVISPSDNYIDEYRDAI